MNRLIPALNRAFLPLLTLVAVATDLILLACLPGGKGAFALVCLFSALPMAGLYWSIRGILSLVRRRATNREYKGLILGTEVFTLLLAVAVIVGVILAWDIPPVWAFLTVPLWGFGGALRAHGDILE